MRKPRKLLLTTLIIAAVTAAHLPWGKGISLTAKASAEAPTDTETLTATEAGASFEPSLPSVKSHLLTPVAGFEPDEKKSVFFILPDGATADSAPKTFYLYRKSTGERVRDGELTQVSGNIYKGDFTDFDEPGIYNCRVRKYGRSVSFEIGQGRYRSLFDESLAALDEYLPKGDIQPAQAFPADDQEEEPDERAAGESLGDSYIGICKDLYIVLFATELFPKSFGFPDTQPGQDLSLNLSQITDQGASSSEFEAMFSPYIAKLHKEDLSSLSSSELYWGGAVFARYSRLLSLRGKNPEASGEYLGEATKMASMALLMDENPSPQRTICSLELYRAGKRPERLKTAEEYLTPLSETLQSDTDLSPEDYLAVTGYLSTPGDTDDELSNPLMKWVMRNAELIAADSQRSDFMVAEGTGQAPEGVLENAYRLSLVNYIIKNHEYDTLSRQYILYLSGLNMEGEDYIKSIQGTGAGLSRLIFLAASLQNTM